MVWPDTSSEQPYQPLLWHLPCTPEQNCKYQLIYFCPDTYLKVWAIWGESGNLSVSCLVHLRAPSTSSFEYSFRKQGKCPFKLFDISSWYLAVLTWGTWRGLQSPCIPKTRLRIFGTPDISIFIICFYIYILNLSPADSSILFLSPVQGCTWGTWPAPRRCSSPQWQLSVG